jgi:hypothetical protein
MRRLGPGRAGKRAGVLGVLVGVLVGVLDGVLAGRAGGRAGGPAGWACWACWSLPKRLGKILLNRPSKTLEILAALDLEVSTERLAKI